jgi:hypothetical protein
MIFRGIHEFSEFFMLKRFWSILALKKCWANWPNAVGKRIKLESKPGRGPKLATPRILVKKNMDFLILSETRVDVFAVKKLLIKWGLLKSIIKSLHRC